MFGLLFQSLKVRLSTVLVAAFLAVILANASPAFGALCHGLLRPDYVPAGLLTDSQQKIYNKLLGIFFSDRQNLKEKKELSEDIDDTLNTLVPAGLYKLIKRLDSPQFKDHQIERISVSILGYTLAIKDSKGVPLFAVKVGITEAAAHGYKKSQQLLARLENIPEAKEFFPEIYEAPDHGVQYMNFIEGQLVGDFLDEQTEEFKNNFENMHFLMSKMAKAIHVLHQNDIVHQDIKPSNFLIQFPADKPFGKKGSLQDARVVLIDFELLGEESDAPSVTAFSFGFVPPERKGRLFRHPVSPLKTDDLFAYRTSALLMNIDPKISTNEDNMSSAEDGDYQFRLNSPFSYNPKISPILSAIAFHRFEQSADLVEALEKAAQFHSANDAEGFLRWFWKNHIPKLSRQKRQETIDKAPEYELIYEPASFRARILQHEEKQNSGLYSFMNKVKKFFRRDK